MSKKSKFECELDELLHEEPFISSEWLVELHEVTKEAFKKISTDLEYELFYGKKDVKDEP